MTQEDKELLLKDLCARLPYRVKIKHITQRADACQAEVSFTERLDVYTLKVMMEFKNEDFPFFLNKPYLFPLSSMTEEQKRDLTSSFKCCIIIKQYEIEFPNYEDSDMDNWIKVITWCYKNHIDIYGLIERGLAIDATGLNIY